MTTVSVVGLGAMGSAIAGRLLETGHQLIVWNRNPVKAAPLRDRGATVAESPADAARRAEAVITMVSDPAALESVTEGPAGVAAGASASTTVIQMSTVAQTAVARLASVLPPGTGLLDAPVLGSVSEAETGTLKIFVGGARALVERFTPLLSGLGSLVHVGALGTGAAAKLVANSTLLGVLGVLGEALALARGLGLPQEVAFEVLSATPMAAQAERRRPAVEGNHYPPRFALSLARKDAELILNAAATSGVDLRLAAAARDWLAEADDAGHGEQDYTVVLGHMLGSC